MTLINRLSSIIYRVLTGCRTDHGAAPFRHGIEDPFALIVLIVKQAHVGVISYSGRCPLRL
jgi:hypothetical protein